MAFSPGNRMDDPFVQLLRRNSMQNLQKDASTLAREKEILDALQHLVGTEYSTGVKDTVAAVSHFEIDNVIGPDDAAAMTYQLYIHTDEGRMITGFGFTQ